MISLSGKKWCRSFGGNNRVVMMTDVEDPNTPSSTEDTDDEDAAKTIDDTIKKDDKDEVKSLVNRWGVESVWQYIQDGGHITNCFHKSVQKGSLICLEALLDYSPPKEVIDAPDHDGKTPLMRAVAQAKYEAAKLLINAGANVNSRSNKGQSALHILALTISAGKKSDQDLSKIVDLLLQQPDIHLESHDNSHLTPLATAILKCDEIDFNVIVEWNLKQSENDLEIHDDDDAHLTASSTAEGKKSQSDATPRSKGIIEFCKKLVDNGASTESKTIKNILQSRQTLSQSTKDLRQKSGPPRPSSSEFLDMIILEESVEKIREFLRNDGFNAANSKLGSHSLLFHAIDRVDKPLVEVLLEAGANPRASEITDELPIYRAAAIGHFDIFNLVLEKMKGDEETVDLSECSFRILQKIIENSADQKEISEDINYSKCLTRLMEKDVIMNLNQEEDDETVLHVAAAFSNQEALSTLLQHGAFLGARRKGIYRIYGNILPYLLPETLKCAMDGCISYQPTSEGTSETENVLSKDYTLKLDYSFLVPPVKTDKDKNPKKINEMKTLMEINRSKLHRPVLKHPLIQALLYAKWSKVYFLCMINVIIYLLFTVLLTFFVYRVRDLRMLEEKVNNVSNFAPSNSTLGESINSLQLTVNGLICFLMIFNFYMFIREIAQIVIDRRIYCNNIENGLEWFLVVAVFVLCFIPLGVNGTRHLAAWAMIVAWYELVLILGRASPLTIYITMLRQVSWNISKFTIVYGILILAFTFSFSMILQPNETHCSLVTNISSCLLENKHIDFGDFWSTLPKMIAMGTGEFEYSSLSEQFTHKVFFHFIFVTFLIFIFLILMNVMIGLAVTDTQEVVEDAKLYSLTTRLELLYLTEVFILKLHRWIPFMAESLLNRFQLISGNQTSSLQDPNRANLYVKVNRPDDLWCVPFWRNHKTESSEGFINLSDETAECLRSHHIQHLEEENRRRHGDSMNLGEDKKRFGDSMNQEENKKQCGDLMKQCLQILEEVQRRLQKA